MKQIFNYNTNSKYLLHSPAFKEISAVLKDKGFETVYQLEVDPNITFLIEIEKDDLRLYKPSTAPVEAGYIEMAYKNNEYSKFIGHMLLVDKYGTKLYDFTDKTPLSIGVKKCEVFYDLGSDMLEESPRIFFFKDTAIVNDSRKTNIFAMLKIIYMSAGLMIPQKETEFGSGVVFGIIRKLGGMEDKTVLTIKLAEPVLYPRKKLTKNPKESKKLGKIGAKIARKLVKDKRKAETNVLTYSTSMKLSELLKTKLGEGAEIPTVINDIELDKVESMAVRKGRLYIKISTNDPATFEKVYSTFNDAAIALYTIIGVD